MSTISDRAVRAPALLALVILTLVPEVSCAAVGRATVRPLAWLKTRHYSALEHYYTRAQRQFESGRLNDSQLYARFRKLYQPSANNERYFDGWVHLYPRSYPARVARGAYLYRMAWFVRGNGARAHTTARQFADMHRYLVRARRDLLASLKMTHKPFLSALYLLNVAMMDGSFEPPQYWLIRGDAIDPTNFLVRRRYMLSLQPQWGGSFVKMSLFLRQCAAQNLDPQLTARLALLFTSDVAEVAMRTNDDQLIFRTTTADLGVAIRAHRKMSTDVLVAYVSSAAKLRRWANANWGLRQLSTRHLHDAWSLSLISYAYWREHRDHKSWALLASAAALKGPWAQYVFGATIYGGYFAVDLPANHSLGLIWIRRAANRCFPEADLFMRIHGHSVPAKCSNSGNLRPTGAVGAVIALLESIEMSINRNLARTTYFPPS